MKQSLRRLAGLTMVLCLLFSVEGAWAQTPFGDDTVRSPVARQGEPAQGLNQALPEGQQEGQILIPGQGQSKGQNQVQSSGPAAKTTPPASSLLGQLGLPGQAGSNGTLQQLYSEKSGSNGQVAKSVTRTIYVTRSEGASDIRQALSAQARRQIQIKLPEFIRKLLGLFGVNIPKGNRIIITIGSGGTTTSTPTTTTPTSTPTSTPTTTTNTTTTPASGQTVPANSTIQSLANQIKARFGIDTVNGDRATWSQRQLEETYKVLNSLPAAFRMYTKTFQRDGIYQNSANVLGWVMMGIPTVHLANSACKDGTFQGTIVHEMTHCFQASNPDITRKWQTAFWPGGASGGARPPSVSNYGNTQPNEDMAESVRAYWANGKAMKSSQPARYEFIKRYVMNGQEF